MDREFDFGGYPINKAAGIAVVFQSKVNKTNNGGANDDYIYDNADGDSSCLVWISWVVDIRRRGSSGWRYLDSVKIMEATID